MPRSMIWWRPIIRCGQSGRAAFWELTDAKGVAVLAGEAGTGKSTTLAAVRDAYEVAGYRVIGMSWTNQVVQNLKPDGFRDATTVAAELYRLDRGSTRWDSRTVLIVDEASMLLTKHLAEVTAQTRAAGAKLILAGDDKQLASIERGGLFGELKEQYGGAELHEVVRVSDAEQRRAFNLMHQGEFLPALAIYARQRAIDWSGGQDETRETLVRQWGRDLAADPDKVRFVFAYANADVPALNAALREVRKKQEALGDDHRLKTADVVAPFARGDRIQFTGTAARREDRQVGSSMVVWARSVRSRATGSRSRLTARPEHRSASSPSSPATIMPRANSTNSGAAMRGRSTKGRGARSIRATSITAGTGAAHPATSR